MAYIKPGTEIKGQVWTGKRWVKKPERMSDKVNLQNEIKRNSVNTEGSGAGARRVKENQMRKAKASYPGGAPRMTQGGSSATKNLEGGMRPVPKQKAKPKDTGDSPSPKPKPATPSTAKSTGATVGGGKTKAPASKRPTVSQSKTMWVKKGDVVNGKTVDKGYVAQLGKPERKVSAKVKLVVDTARGKAGSKVSYDKGRATKGKGK